MSDLNDQSAGSDGWNVDPSPAPQTSIDSILDSSREEPATADVTARPTPEDREERSRIPVAAIRRERERREKYDREVQRLEAEISKYNDQKWGFTEEPTEQSSESPTFDPAQLQALDRSMGGFAARHGQSRLSALETAVTRLTPAQQDEARAYAAGKKDQVAAIHEYVQKAGLLDAEFRRAGINDILSGKASEPKPEADTSHVDQRFAEREQSLQRAERRATLAGSKSEFISEFGRAKYQELDAALGHWAESGDPRVAQFVQAASAHDDPVVYAAAIMQQLGLWTPEQAEQQPQRPAVTFPSNLAGARNVGARRGPEWGGPRPLQDIFDRNTRPGAA